MSDPAIPGTPDPLVEHDPNHLTVDAPSIPESFEEGNPRPLRRGLQITLALLVVIVCLELGLFLLVFPWTDHWTNNYLATIIPKYFWIWDSAYLKGAVSGLGVVNLCICVSEILRLRRFAGTE